MMKLSEVRENYYTHTGKVSDICRQMSLAGIGLVWIFHTTVGEGVKIPESLARPLLLIVGALAADFLQYVAGSLLWGAYGRIKEKSGATSDTELSVPAQMNWPALLFFWLKAGLVLWAYILMLNYLRKSILLA